MIAIGIFYRPPAVKVVKGQVFVKKSPTRPVIELAISYPVLEFSAKTGKVSVSNFKGLHFIAQQLQLRHDQIERKIYAP
jgi:hypothetical protein